MEPWNDHHGKEAESYAKDKSPATIRICPNPYEQTIPPLERRTPTYLTRAILPQVPREEVHKAHISCKKLHSEEYTGYNHFMGFTGHGFLLFHSVTKFHNFQDLMSKRSWTQR